MAEFQLDKKLEYIEHYIDEDPSILVMLMKLKLSLSTKTPAELAHYIDKILKILKSSNE